MPTCPHRPPCPGCPQLDVPVEVQRVEKHARAARVLAACAAGVALAPVVYGPDRGYRTRARLAVRGNASAPRIGLFEEGTHRVADGPTCLIHHPAINRAAAAVREGVRALHVHPYEDDPHAGLLRYLALRVQRRSGKVQLALVGRAEDPAALAPLADWLRRKHGEGFHSIFGSVTPGRTNQVFGDRWRRFSGPEHLHEEMAGVPLRLSPRSFTQSNLDLAERMVREIAGWLPLQGTEVAAELYAGVGAIGFALLDRVAGLRWNDLEEAAEADARATVRHLGVGRREKVTFHRGPAAERADEALRGADLAILDPPRKGCEAAVLDAIARHRPARVVYVSCDVETLAPDLGRLTASGYRVGRLVPYDLFPHTPHIEVVASLDRSDQAG